MDSPQTLVGKKLVVFDLNGCLCKTDYDGKEFGAKGPCDFKVRRKHIYVRPFIHTMLAEVTANYDIAVWTCNGKPYALPLARALFGQYYSQLKFVWTSDNCTVDAVSGEMTKDLDKITSHCGRDIVLVDDTDTKKVGTSGSGLVHIQSFIPFVERIDVALLGLKTRIDDVFKTKCRLSFV